MFKKAVKVLHLSKLFKVVDLNQIIDTMYDVSKEETDFSIEVSHMLEFNKNNFDFQYVGCPKVYVELCTKNIIVMDYISGIEINKVDELRKANYNLSSLAEVLSENYVKQALEDGFFHADPHPDNILINSSGIVFIDFGMMGRLSKYSRDNLKKCVRGIILRDYGEVTRTLVDLSAKLADVDYKKLEYDITVILDEFADSKLENISIAKFIQSMFYMLRNNNLLLDKDVTLLIRGIGIIEASIQGLNPELSLIKVLMLSEEYNITNMNVDKITDISKNIIKKAKDVASIPTELSEILKSINSGDIKFKVEMSDSTRQVDKLENLVHELILGFLVGCLIIAIVVVNNSQIELLLATLTTIFASWLIIKMIYDFWHKGY